MQSGGRWQEHSHWSAISIFRPVPPHFQQLDILAVGGVFPVAGQGQAAVPACTGHLILLAWTALAFHSPVSLFQPHLLFVHSPFECQTLSHSELASPTKHKVMVQSISCVPFALHVPAQAPIPFHSDQSLLQTCRSHVCKCLSGCLLKLWTRSCCFVHLFPRRWPYQ